MPRSRERMSGVDTAWLRMEQPVNLMMITGIMVFDEVLDLNLLKAALKNHFTRFRRFRQCAVEDLTGAYWEDDAHFNIDAHVHKVGLPGDAGKAELEALVSDLASTPLDHGMPLWQFHLVDNYLNGSALIMRIHHCYADGIAMIHVLLSMTETEKEASAQVEPNEELEETPAEAPETSLLQKIYEPATDLIARSVKGGFKLWTEGLKLALNPGQLADYAKHTVQFTAELGKITMLKDDPPSRLKGELGTQKTVAWAEPLPLADVKSVGKSLNCTVNDVLLSSAAGAIGAYLRDAGDDIDGLEIRAVVPVNLRPLEEAKKLGNHFGMVFLSLPVGVQNPLKRIYSVHAQMTALKSSYQPVVSLGVLMALGTVPGVIEQPVLDLLSNKATAVMSNVPGPQRTLYFGGCRITEQMFWVPQNGKVGVGVSILSYDGRVHFGIIADENLIPAPHEIVDRFGKEFDELGRAVHHGVDHAG